MASFLLPKPLCFLSLGCSRSSASCLTHHVAIWLGLTGWQLLRHYIKATEKTSQSSADIHLFVCYWVISSSSFIVRWRICWLSGHHGNSRQLCPAGGGLPNVIENKENQFHLNLHDLRNHFEHTEPFLKENIAGFAGYGLYVLRWDCFRLLNCWCYCLCNLFMFFVREA